MNKLKTLVKAPALVNCGYGTHSKQILFSLLKNPIFDVYVDSLRWGNCAFLTEDTEEKRIIKHCVRKHMEAKQRGQDQYDLFIHVTIPNEWERLGKVNIGVTAGIETDRVSPNWVQKCNEMDLIIVPSEHSKKVFENTIVDWRAPDGSEGSFKVEKPIIVCPEGVNTNIFKNYRGGDAPKSYLNFYKKHGLEFEPDFCFLSIGQWGKGGFGEDRKNIANLVKWFIESFSSRKDVGLVLKISMSRNNMIDYEMIKDRLNQIKANYKPEDVPPIYLVHGNLTDEEMSALYNHPKIKSYVSLTNGEGYGLPLLEAAACGLPIIATNWSGHLDFLKKGLFSAVEYELKEIPDVAVWDPILIKGSRWANVKEEDATRRLKKMVSSYGTPKRWAEELSEKVQEELDLEVTATMFSDVVNQFLLSVQEEKGLSNPVEILQSYVDTKEDYNILYTMPMSNGDVFISSAVIDGLMKDIRKQQPEAKLYFATGEEYYSILEDNPNVHKCIPWREYMMHTDVTEEVFDLVLTPNIGTQLVIGNWVRRGQGRLLAEEFANHCQTELGDYFIKTENPEDGIPDGPYVTFHAGSGKDKWESRHYVDWPEVLKNLKGLYSNLKVVQVGAADDMEYAELVDEDLRGKTSVHQLASLVKEATLHVGIDSFPMHLAGSYNTPLVAIFGCSHATSTGPWVKDKTKAKFYLLESERITCGCKKACYKNKPAKTGNGYPTINEIDPKEIFQACVKLLEQVEKESKENV